MQEKILLIEDDHDIVELVKYNLEKANFQVMTARKGLEGLEQAKKFQPALILLDVMLPDADGFELCKRMRADSRLAPVPILFLTAKAEELDKVIGLEIGADDYITKPFSPRELVARVKAHLRRVAAGYEAAPHVLKCGGIELNRDDHALRISGKLVELSATEFKLLEFFLLHPNRVYSRDQLLDAVWSREAFVTPRTVDVHIRRLREKIERKPEQPAYLKTARGFGYKFELPS